jgi:hypothetical protein
MAYEIRDALDWYDEALSRDQHNRDDYETNQEFLAGEQWSEKDKQRRGEGAVVVNKLDTPVVLVVNQVSQALPGPKVERRDGVDDEGVADVYEGILRDIEYVSGASDRYLRQLDYATGGNIGFLRLFVDYLSEDSFDQELRIGDVADPMMAVLDPDAQEPDKSDMKRFILRQPVTFEEYKQRFGRDPEEAHKGFAGTSSQMGQWYDLPRKSLWIAEDWKLEYEKKRLLRVAGKDIFDDDVRSLRMAAAMNGGVIQPEMEETRYVPKVVQRIIDGTDVLEEKPWRGKRIPFFPIVGTERYVKGRRRRKSIVSDARSSQRLYNYVTAQEILDFRNAPTSKFLVGAAAMAGHENQYRDVTDPDVTILSFNEYDEQGRQLNPPLFQRFEPPIQNYIIAKQQHEADIQQLTRTPPAALGIAQGSQESGERVKQLQQQSGLANSHAGRGLKLAVQALYREAICCIPKVYSGPQAKRIIGADNKQAIVWINQHLSDNPRPDPKTGRVKAYNLSEGRYDVVADIGPSYQTQQQETADRLIELSKVVPQLVQNAPDVIVDLQNLGPKAQEAIDRITPQQFKEQAQPGSPEADKQRLQQLDQAAQMLQQQLEQATEIIKTEQIKAQNQYKIAELNAITQLRMKEMDVDAKTAIAGMQSQIDRINEDLKYAREARLQSQQHAHEAGIEAMAHAHALQQGMQAHDHAVVQTDQQQQHEQQQAEMQAQQQETVPSGAD